MLRAFIILSVAVLLTSFGPPEDAYPIAGQKRYRIFDDSKWVDSVMQSMTLEEKIGQLFMIAAWSSKDKANLEEATRMVQQYNVGGIIFFKGSPYKQAEMTNSLQSKAKIPLLVGIDAEWGLAMRLDSTVNFGYQMPLGAVQDDSLIYKMGREIAYECKRLGIHINFAPVVDINNNPLNPVINLRSFGEDKEEVAHKALMYLQGLQDQHILAVAKHFPGHGNVDVDSHLDLPVLSQSKGEMDTLELYPFRYMFMHGVGGVMTAHLHIPAYDTTEHVGASLSCAVTTDLLKRKMKFRGLIFSDALNMKGVSKFYPPGELELRALMAGNDVLLYSEDVPKAIHVIKQAVDSGCLSEEVINFKVRRILEVKKWAGLDQCRYVQLNHLTQDLNNQNALLIKQHIAEEAVTLVKNTQKLIPLKDMEKHRYASVAFGTKLQMPFQDMLANYGRNDYYQIPMLAGDDEYNRLWDTLKRYDVIILSLHHLSNKNTVTYGLSTRAIDFINRLNKEKNCVLVSFGTPYALNRFPDFKTVVCAYQDENIFQYSAAQMIYGGVRAEGRLPVTASTEYPLGAGLITGKPIRFEYAIPEEAGFSAEKLQKIDDITNGAIFNGAMPGCQILVARNGKVVYQKSFGKQTYNGDPVQNNDLYDLASVTKVAATTLAAMKLYEQGKLNIFDPLSKYLPELKGTNKADLQIKEIMTHQAGLQSWIPFYKKTVTKGRPDTGLFCNEPNELYTLRVADNLYMSRLYKDSIFSIIDKTPIENRGKMHYSDLGFIYMQRVIEKIVDTTLDAYVDSVFYRPLGLSTMTFRPRERFPLPFIVPTERDTYFRQQLVHGDVHDPAAAMLGGVAGHAGLFSNANDVAILMQMLLNGGSYGGKKYLKPSTVSLFTSKQFSDNKRGLGWDKPEEKAKVSPASQYASSRSFGHTGFTGTCVWADPDKGLIYVFLSNRVYPTAENNKLLKMNVRTDIHDAIYEALAGH